MLCDFCHKREAVFFIEQVNKNSRKKLNICMECAVKRGISPDPHSIEKSIGHLFEEFTEKNKKQSELKSNFEKLCPVCGRKLKDMLSTGQIGCPECYSVFSSELEDLMDKKNIMGKYMGSMPQRLESFHSILTDRAALQSKLEKSIQEENYEKAAMYRDYLKALEKSPVSGTPDNIIGDIEGSSKENKHKDI